MDRLKGASLPRSHYKQKRPYDIAVVVLGDLAVFLVFVILGTAEHEIIQVQAFVRTTLPFAIIWFVGSPWLGAYQAPMLYNSKQIAWKLPLIWLRIV